MGNKKSKYPARLFGVLLQEIFEFLYIRHSDFAEKIDVDCSTISAWATSKQKPRSIKIEPIVSTISSYVHAFPENKKNDLKKLGPASQREVKDKLKQYLRANPFCK